MNFQISYRLFHYFLANRNPPLKPIRGPNLFGFGNWRVSVIQFYNSGLKITLKYNLEVNNVYFNGKVSFGKFGFVHTSYEICSSYQQTDFEKLCSFIKTHPHIYNLHTCSSCHYYKTYNPCRPSLSDNLKPTVICVSLPFIRKSLSLSDFKTNQLIDNYQYGWQYDPAAINWQ